MNKQYKRMLSMVFLIMGLVVLVSCNKEGMKVSNLTDDKTLEEVAKTLTDAGLNEERVHQWTEDVKVFSETKGMEGLISGFKPLGLSEKTYDDYELQDAWVKAHPDFEGYNCRITAWELAGNFIKIKDNKNPDESSLMIDELSLSQKEEAFSSNELDNFKAFYSTVTGEATTDQAIQKKKVLEEMEKRGIAYDLPKGLSLVEVYVHGAYSEEDNELFVGHVGVLVDKGNDGLLFIEKVGFQAPYRAVKLQNRSELYDYLMANYGVHSEELEMKPFILENGKEMEH